MSSGPVRPVDVGRGQQVRDESTVAGLDEDGQDDDEDAADDRGAQGLDQLHRPTSHQQVGAHADRQEQHADATHPAQERQQQSREPTRGISEVLLHRAAGAGGEVGRETAPARAAGPRRPGALRRLDGGPVRGWAAR